jgi:hypothetical protein
LRQSYRVPTSSKPLIAMAQPSRVITAALATGRYRVTTLPSPVKRVITGLATTRRIPIATSTLAKPMLKLTRITNPRVIRFKAMAINSTINASGQGTNPPEIPRDKRLPRDTSEVLEGKGVCKISPSWAR